MKAYLRQKNQGLFYSMGGDIIYPVRYSWNCIGGPKTAEVIVKSSTSRLMEIGQYLRSGVGITDDLGNEVWYGFVNSISIYTAGMEISFSLDLMWNSIKVQYSNGVKSETTSAGTDDSSILDYGTKEILISYSDIDNATAAEAARDMLISYYGKPKSESRFNASSDNYAVLNCLGWWYTLDWKYYTNTGTSSVDTTVLISDIVTNAGQHLNGTFTQASGVNVLETRDGSQRAGSEIKKLLDIGGSNGRRLLAKVMPDRVLYVYEEQNRGVNSLKFKKNKLTKDTIPVPLSTCPAGEWLLIDDDYLGDNQLINSGYPGNFFIEESEYNVEERSWTPTPRGSYMPGDLL